ncbi:DUF2279 domain-containing protein [Fulvivirga sediminis]|nr:DUF2279 domain-containing protein [Fulvivirga sediminis]
MKMTPWNKTIALLVLSLVSYNSLAQDSLKQQKRLKPLIITSAGAYTVSMIGLNHLWYSDYERESFHFFNDNKEWNQVDKFGHFYSAFHLTSGGDRILHWAGLGKNKSILWSALATTLVMTSIEVFDGFSAEYGASYGDAIANSAGTLFYVGQQKLWDEIRIHPKFSFRITHYPDLRPELLGSNLSEQILKDYNGQTYWFSFNLSKFIKSPFPKWLNVAAGYGTTDMIYANKDQNLEMGFNPQRRYLLSIDLDLSEYESRSKVVNTLIYLVNTIHIPAPSLEMRDDELKFHFFY